LLEVFLNGKIMLGWTNIDYIDVKWAKLQAEVISERSKGSLGSIVYTLPGGWQGVDVRADVDDRPFAGDEEGNEGFHQGKW
jgi:hypothetical protein